MNSPENSVAFGAPGIESRWTSSAKEGVGTAYHTSCRVWFTLSHGIVNEIYYPHIDQPNTRDFQFLITDGETFCHEEKRDLTHAIEYPDRDCLFYRLTNSEPAAAIVGKHVLSRSASSVFARAHKTRSVRRIVSVGSCDSMRCWRRTLAGLAPATPDGARSRRDQTASTRSGEDVHLLMACSTGSLARSVGYVGFSDGWQDLMHNFKMDWHFDSRERQYRVDGEIRFAGHREFTSRCALVEATRAQRPSCSNRWPSLSSQSAKRMFVSGSARRESQIRFQRDTSDGGGMYRLSRCVLLAHEDKVFKAQSSPR
jgi:glucoamylase